MNFEDGKLPELRFIEETSFFSDLEKKDYIAFYLERIADQEQEKAEYFLQELRDAIEARSIFEKKQKYIKEMLEIPFARNLFDQISPKQEED